ncbi:MAG: TatD family hydrolase [Pseudomonadales bacterium]
MFTDSHCHLNYLDDPDAAIASARQAAVTAMLCISVEEQTMPAVHALATRHDNVWASAGLHPEQVEPVTDWIEPWLAEPFVVAVGETGLDYHQGCDAARRKQQLAAFETQMHLAQKHQLPVIVHTRAAVEDTLAIMANFPDVQGVLHCFTETWAMAEQALEQGYYISLSGIVTFRSAESLRDVARRVPADRLLIETDAPWLAPVPHRGKTNEPALLPHTAALIAQLRGLPVAELAQLTTRNFERLFRVEVAC